MSESLHIALLGAGQLGGAFALALRAANPDIHITAYDPAPNASAQLVALGGATSVADSAAMARFRPAPSKDASSMNRAVRLAKVSSGSNSK